VWGLAVGVLLTVGVFLATRVFRSDAPSLVATILGWGLAFLICNLFKYTLYNIIRFTLGLRGDLVFIIIILAVVLGFIIAATALPLLLFLLFTTPNGFPQKVYRVSLISSFVISVITVCIYREMFPNWPGRVTFVFAATMFPPNALKYLFFS
jgi:hypothetical protein